MKCRQWPPIEIKIHLISLPLCVIARCMVSNQPKRDFSWCFTSCTSTRAHTHTVTRRQGGSQRTTPSNANECASCVAMDTVWTLNEFACCLCTSKPDRQDAKIAWTQRFYFSLPPRIYSAQHHRLHSSVRCYTLHSMTARFASTHFHLFTSTSLWVRIHRKHAWCDGFHPNSLFLFTKIIYIFHSLIW